MNQHASNKPVILAIALSWRGVGFAVIEGRNTLVDWGMKATSGDKNAGAVAAVKRLIAQYQPSAFVIDH